MSHRREQVISSKSGPPNIRGSLPAESRVASFVIRLHLDEATRWRGHITHVQSEERKHVRSLRQLDDFILRHLAELGLRRPGPLKRFWRWLKRNDR